MVDSTTGLVKDTAADDDKSDHGGDEGPALS